MSYDGKRKTWFRIKHEEKAQRTVTTKETIRQQRIEEANPDTRPDPFDLSTASDDLPTKHSPYTPREVSSALLKKHGMIGGAATLLGVSPDVVRRYISTYSECAEAMRQGRLEFDDTAEEKLFDLILQGNANVTMFYARTRLGARGYREQLQPDLIPYEVQEKLQALCEKTGVPLDTLTKQLQATLERLDSTPADHSSYPQGSEPRSTEASTSDAFPVLPEGGDI